MHDDVKYIVDALRGLVDQEFKITERLSAKARQAFTLAAAVFTVAQTITFGSFKVNLVGQTERIVMVACAILALVFLAGAARATVKVDKDVPDKDLDLDVLAGRLEALYDQNDPYVPLHLSNDYFAVVKARREANDTRRKNNGKVRRWVGLALGMTVIELVVALVARI